jgi:hypothetical protein
MLLCWWQVWQLGCFGCRLLPRSRDREIVRATSLRPNPIKTLLLMISRWTSPVLRVAALATGRGDLKDRAVATAVSAAGPKVEAGRAAV